MGEVNVEIELENFVDRVDIDQGMIRAEQVRSFRIRALVDTGAVMNLLPHDLTPVCARGGPQLSKPVPPQFSRSGLRVLRSGKAEKSRSAVQSSETP